MVYVYDTAMLRRCFRCASLIRRRSLSAHLHHHADYQPLLLMPDYAYATMFALSRRSSLRRPLFMLLCYACGQQGEAARRRCSSYTRSAVRANDVEVYDDVLRMRATPRGMMRVRLREAL